MNALEIILATVEPGQPYNLQALHKRIEQMPQVKRAIIETNTKSGKPFIRMSFRDAHPSDLDLEPDNGVLNASLSSIGCEYSGVLRVSSTAVILSRIDKLAVDMRFRSGRSMNEIADVTRQALHRFCL